MADCDDDSTSSSSDEEYEKIVAQSAPEEEGVFNTLSALSKTLGHVNRGRKHDNYRHGRRHNYGGRDYDDPHGIMGYLDFLSRPKHMGVLKRHGLLKKLGPLGGVLLGMKGHHKGRQHGGGGRHHGGGGRHGGRRRNHGNHDFGRLGNLGKGAWGRKGRRKGRGHGHGHGGPRGGGWGGPQGGGWGGPRGGGRGGPRGGRGCYRGIRMHNFHGLGAVLGGEEYHSGSDSGDSDSD